MHSLSRRFLSPLDLAVLCGLVAGIGWIVHRATGTFSYDWQWDALPQYLWRFDPRENAWGPGLLLEGLFVTIRLSFWSMLLALLIGGIMGMFRCSTSLFRRMVGRTYVEAVRNLPPLVLVFIFYFFVSEQIMPHLGVDEALRGLPPAGREFVALFLAPPRAINAFLSGVAALALYEAAYIAEIVRAGIQSLERGQWEAATALGLTRRQMLRTVILPQALRRMLPALAGQFVSTIKDSSIVSIISIQELTYQGMALISSTYLSFETWIVVFSLYLVICLCCSTVVNVLDRRMRASA